MKSTSSSLDFITKSLTVEKRAKVKPPIGTKFIQKKLLYPVWICGHRKVQDKP